MSSVARDEASQGRVAFRLRVGVTGHRDVGGDERTVACVRDAISAAIAMLPERRSTPILLRAVSPLAEGADRLVARLVLEHPRSDLEAPLPFGPSEYEKDFGGERSVSEFRSLLERAHAWFAVASPPSRSYAYDAVGRYVADESSSYLSLFLAAHFFGGCREPPPRNVLMRCARRRVQESQVILIGAIQPRRRG